MGPQLPSCAVQGRGVSNAGELLPSPIQGSLLLLFTSNAEPGPWRSPWRSPSPSTWKPGAASRLPSPAEGWFLEEAMCDSALSHPLPVAHTGQCGCGAGSIPLRSSWRDSSCSGAQQQVRPRSYTQPWTNSTTNPSPMDMAWAGDGALALYPPTQHPPAKQVQPPHRQQTP